MRIVIAALTLAAAFSSGRARADDLVELTLEPWSAYDGTARPYRYIVSMRARGDDVEAVLDRRLLSFELSEGRRTLRCAHPEAPSRASAGRVRTLGGRGPDGIWREWIDLRMYCTGPALATLERGATLRVRYGWPRRGRDRWVARRQGQPTSESSEERSAARVLSAHASGAERRAGRQWAHGVDAPSIAFPATSPIAPRGASRAPVVVALEPASARTASGLALRVSIRAREGTRRIFVRPDSWHFRVRGPLGDVTCREPMGGGAPPAELFRRITPRAPVRHTLDAQFFCPAGTFDVAGVYEITPKVRLPHSGEEWGYEAVTGQFSGAPAPIRITRGAHAYVEQIPERADEGDE